MTALSLVIRQEHPDDVAAIDRLHARAFGPGRFARTAYRLREGVDPLPRLCFTALVGTYLVGSIRMGPARAGGQPLIALGPLTVDPSFSHRGVGCSLMRAGLEAAKADGHGLVVLVGDAPYYQRFGFSPVPPGRLVLPGPVDPGRVLWLELAEGACATTAGNVSALRGTPASSMKHDASRASPLRSAREGGPCVSKGRERGAPFLEEPEPAPLPPAPQAPPPAERGG